MCFSAGASFAVGAALMPAGIYCVRQARRKRTSYLGLAAMPLFFGIQQVSEGFVWLALGRDDPSQAQSASLSFLFFALAVWPFWLPFQAALMETRPVRRRMLIGATVLATIWFWILFFPLALDADRLLTTHIKYHSIHYDFSDLPIYRFVSKEPLRLLYFATVAFPFAISSERLGTLPVIALGATAVIAAIIYENAFVSVWCFFAAVLAGFLCLVFYRLPQPAAVRSQMADALSSFPRRNLENNSP